jgi:hypothetical protein
VGHPLQHRNAHPEVLLEDVLELRPTASSDLGHNLAITVMKVIAMFLTEKQTWHCEFLEKKKPTMAFVLFISIELQVTIWAKPRTSQRKHLKPGRARIIFFKMKVSNCPP